MNREHLIIAVLLAIILIFAIFLTVSILNDGDDYKAVKNSADDAEVTHRETLANNSDDPGTVEVIRNIGNPNGEKIAYVVGVHPLEHETHETLVKLLPNMSDLNKSYDLYIINVTEDVGYYGDGSDDSSSPGRQNGQNLAYEYVYPEIQDGDYALAIDVHSNVGGYEYKTFVFSPIVGGLGEKYAKDVADNSPDIAYFAPSSTTSGPFLTVPLNENGIPAFYFEEYSFASQGEKDSHMLELIGAVDGLDFK